MLKRIAVLLIMLLSLGLQSCVSLGVGLNTYVNEYEGYEFAYPNGWVEINVSNGPDVVFHDIIEESENVSVVISPVANGKDLSDLGTPTDVGQRIAQNVITSDDAGRKAELVNATSTDIDGETYYFLEYTVQLPTQQRHNLASAVVRRGKLFTYSASTRESRWSKMEETFQQSVGSFRVY